MEREDIPIPLGLDQYTGPAWGDESLPHAGESLDFSRSVFFLGGGENTFFIFYLGEDFFSTRKIPKTRRGGPHNVKTM